MIGNLQLLRGLAAMAVVFYHTAFLLPGDIHTDFKGVATFFVISGFIMCFISEKDPSRFFARRLLRIVPLYWVCTLALELFTRNFGFLEVWRWHADFAQDFLRSLLFFPSQEHPLLGVGWTLNLEMYFYAIFAVALWLNTRLAPVIAGVVVLGGLALPSLGCHLAACEVYAHSYVWYFIWGIAVFYLWRWVASSLPRWPTIVLCWATIALCFGIDFQPETDWTRLAPVVLVAAALFMTSVGHDMTWKPLVVFGDASYATYLTHTIAMHYVPPLVAASVIAPPSTSLWSMLVVLITCQIVGLATHLYVERPLGRALRERSKLRAVFFSPKIVPGNTANRLSN